LHLFLFSLLKAPLLPLPRQASPPFFFRSGLSCSSQFPLPPPRARGFPSHSTLLCGWAFLPPGFFPFLPWFLDLVLFAIFFLCSRWGSSLFFLFFSLRTVFLFRVRIFFSFLPCGRTARSFAFYKPDHSFFFCPPIEDGNKSCQDTRIRGRSFPFPPPLPALERMQFFFFFFSPPPPLLEAHQKPIVGVFFSPVPPPPFFLFFPTLKKGPLPMF